MSKRGSNENPLMSQLFFCLLLAGQTSKYLSLCHNWTIGRGIHRKVDGHNSCRHAGERFEATIRAIEYRGVEWAAEMLMKLLPDPSILILDVGAGTGLFAKQLRKQAPGKYENIEALEPNDAMMRTLKEERIYKRFHECKIGAGHRPDLPEGKVSRC